MTQRAGYIVAGIFGFCAIQGCSTSTLLRAQQLSELQPYKQAKLGLPQLLPGSMRIFVYRPHFLMGAAGSAIVRIDGKLMGDPAHPLTDNLLLPSTVFVVDTPARVTRVTWRQPGRAEEVDLPLELAPEISRTWYLRWELRPSYGFLQPIDEKEAVPEIEVLRLSGYLNLVPPSGDPQ